MLEEKTWNLNHIGRKKNPSKVNNDGRKNIESQSYWKKKNPSNVNNVGRKNGWP